MQCFFFRDNVEWDEEQEEKALARIKENSTDLISIDKKGWPSLLVFGTYDF